MFKTTKKGSHWGWFAVIAVGVFTGIKLLPMAWDWISSKIPTKGA